MKSYNLIIEGSECTASTVKVGCKFFVVVEDGFEIYKKTTKSRVLLSHANTFFEVYEHANNLK